MIKFIDQEDEILKSYISKKIRPRIKINEYQEDILNKAYQINPYPTKVDKIELHILTKLPVKNLKIWFQNKRSRTGARKINS